MSKVASRVREYLVAVVIIAITRGIAALILIIHLPIVLLMVVREMFSPDAIALEKYAYNTLRLTDIMASSLLFGTERATISGWTYYLGEKRNIKGYERIYKLINKLAFDPNHCKDSYEYEAEDLKLKEYRGDFQ